MNERLVILGFALMIFNGFLYISASEGRNFPATMSTVIAMLLGFLAIMIGA